MLLAAQVQSAQMANLSQNLVLPSLQEPRCLKRTFESAHGHKAFAPSTNSAVVQERAASVGPLGDVGAVCGIAQLPPSASDTHCG